MDLELNCCENRLVLEEVIDYGDNLLGDAGVVVHGFIVPFFQING